jgi:simple sugar transport system ATP-binding protein
MDTPFFELRGIDKYFSRVIANKDVSFAINQGQVLALLGENGAGKSTCMKILYGLYRADNGHIFRNGKEIHISSPRDAMKYRISMIQQHFSLVYAHTVTENIILGTKHGSINWKQEHEHIRQLAASYGFGIDPTKKIRDLSVGEQQKVEILKALYLDAHLLIMDEPTAVLTPQETESLMAFVRTFVGKGNSVIFITHKLAEVMQVADRIIIMRNGMVHGDVLRSNTNAKDLSNMMIGHELSVPNVDSVAELQDEILRLEHVTLQAGRAVPSLEDLSFSVHAGEIFGIAGVSGNGQQELCDVLCGRSSVSQGNIFLGSAEITQASIKHRIDLGLGYVPSDRQRFGMVMDMSLSENLMLRQSFDGHWTRYGFIRKKELDERMQELIDSFSVKAPGPEVVARSLSGGNQQKVIVAREVSGKSQVVIFDQPTRGLDLGAINHVHQTILAQRKEGKAILLISTELSEIFALSDRIAVLYKGKIQGIYPRGTLSTERIGLLMAGYREDATHER